jgi:hypothetical protein
MRLVWDQKLECIKILKGEISALKTGTTGCWLVKRDDDKKTLLILLRNAYRILKGTPMGWQVFFDPTTTE